MQFPLSAPRTAPAGRAHALLARGLPFLIALAALVLSSVGHAQTLDPVLVSNTGQTAGSDLATATGRVSYAQSFTTGVHPDGYFLSSVDVGLKADSGVTAEVALWRANRDVRAPRIGFHFLPANILTTLSEVDSIDDDTATLERFSANDVLLLPGTTYWIVVTRTGGADDGLSVATTSSEDAVDAVGMAGFSVGNNVWVPDPDYNRGWADYSGSVDASMKIGLRGSEATRPPGPYATNRNEKSRAAAAETSPSTSGYATSFTTASNPDTHQLTSVLLGVAAEAGVSPRVAIHADNSGSPAASALTNGTLTAPADVSRVLGAPDRAEFTTSPAISLDGGTRYWVVLDVGSGTGSLSVSTTASDRNDEILRVQWSIGDTMKAYSGTSWSNDSQGRSFRMALNGPTDQYTGSPFEPLRTVPMGLPQVGVGVAAKIQDGSLRVKNATWQWQRGETSDGTFTDIPAAQGGTSHVYVPVAADLGKWLKALATYENAFGPGKMVSGVSPNAVLSQPIMSNAGQNSDVGYALQQPDTVNIAQAFTTGGNPSGYSLSGLRFGINIDTGADALSWALHDDAAGEPAAEPLFPEIAAPSDSLDSVSNTFEELVHPGFPLAPDTKYWAVLTSSPLMEGTVPPTLTVAGISEWGDNVILDGPAAELDPGSKSGWTLDFSTLASPQDPMSTEEWVRFTKALELDTYGKIVLRMSVLTHPQVTASFGQESHTVAEGATQSVTVTLSADPERTVTIPIVTMGQDGATDADYSGVPDSVTFNAGGPTEMTFTFTATQDTVDDEGESVLLGFGPDLSGGVRAGTPDETTLTITDDDPPEVSFGQSAYTVAEGGMVSVEVKLTSAPASAVTVPVTHTPQGATSSADYSGVPSSVTFSAGETSKTFSFTATQDTVDDDGESVLLTFGTLPATVQTGTTTQSTVTITDDDAAEVSFGQSAYTVAEGGMVSVEVKLTSAPASAVTVPVTHTPQGATSSADYSGVPSSVTFSAGETSKTFSFTATQDTVDDDGESVLLTFGTLPATVQTGTTTETTVTITDVDEPPSAPATPAVSAVSGSTTSLSVSWAAPANAGKPAIASYDVQYRAGTSGTWSDGPQDVAGTSTTITSLAADTAYQARVRATNAEGDSGWSDPPGSGRTNTPGTSAPGAPGELGTTPGDGRVTLAWTAPGSDGGAAILKYQYRAQRTGTPAWTPNWTDVPDGSDSGGSAADETTFTVSGLTNGTEYVFQLRAVNSVGAGAAASATAAPVRPPLPPGSGFLVGNFGQTADGYARISLTQDIVGVFNTGARGAELHNIELRLFSRLPEIAQIPSATLYRASVTDTRATPGTRVAALTAAPGSPRPAATAQTVAFIAPDDTSLEAGATYLVVLTGSGFVRVESTTFPAEDAGGASGWTIDGVGAGNSSPYSYETTASLLMRVNGTAGATAGTNNAPVFSSSNVSRSIAENTAAGQDVGAAVTATDADAGDTLGYTLGGADAASFDFVDATGQIRTKTNVSYDFEAKSSYTVTVTASDGTATAVASVTIGVTDVDEPPRAPATPAVSAVSGSTTILSVSWVAPANAGKPAIANYDVQYRVGTSGAWIDGPQDVTTTTTTIASLAADTAYQARVRATNAEGDSGWSDPPGSGRTTTPGTSAPGAPTGLAATASGQSRIDLAWTAPVHAGGSAITGYKIEVSPDGSSWTDLVADTQSTATTYAHMGLDPATTRHYRVSAINVVGTSDPSDSDAATTTRTDEQLVSNFNHTGDADNVHLALGNVVGIFTTGRRAAKLNSIELRLGKLTNRTVAPALKLYTLNLDNNGRATLGTEVATLDTPSTSLTVNSFRTFSYQAPSGTSLTASQAYMFVLEQPSRGIVLVETTTDPSEDDVKADGWTIDGWGTGTSPFYIGSNRQIVFRVNGTETPNTAPTADDNTVTMAEDGRYEFSATDFGFNDTNLADRLVSVRIVTVPAAGALALDGTAVTAGEVVARADIDDGDLTFTPVTGGSGDNYASFTFKVNDGTVDSASAYRMRIDVTPTPPLTGRIFVDNTAETDYGVAVAGNLYSQSFTTGPNTGGYILTSIGVVGENGVNDFSVAVFNADTSGAPVALHTSLIPPGNFPEGVSTIHFHAPPNTRLRPDTTYSIVLGPGRTPSRFRQISATQSNADNAGAGGWSIGDALHSRRSAFSPWSSPADDRSVKIVIRGNAASGVANNAPAFSPATVDRSIAENTAAGVDIGAVVTATDADNDPLSYTLGGADMASFDFVEATGQIRTKADVSYDHEAKPSYTVTVTATDGVASAVANVTISVTDVNEPPVAPATPAVSAVAGSTTSLSVSWVAPANAGRPAIDSYEVQYRVSGATDWTDGPDHSTTTAVTGPVSYRLYAAQVTGLIADTLYEARVRAANDEGNSGWSHPPGSGRTNTLTNNAPVFSPAIVARSIAENIAADEDIGAAVTATDADAGDSLSYTLGGADMASFDFVETTGQIRTKANVSYDHEAKPSYTVTVTASDGAATANANVTISVTDVAEPPDAPATPTVTAVTGSTTSLTVSWAAPANAGRPAIDSYDVQYRVGSSGTWTDVPQDVTGTTTSITSLAVDRSYEVRVRAANAEGDSGWSDPPGSGRTHPLTHIAPMFSSSSQTREIAENTAAGEDVGGAVTATDVNNDTLSYTLGGVDAGSFDFVETTGQIRTKANVSYDHEAKSSYTVTVTASDGAATAVANVTISITDVAEPPDAPATPIVSAVAGSTPSLSVSWAAPANEGRPPIESYSVQWRVSGATVSGAKDVTTTTTIISELVANTEYEVRVNAKNDEGDSGFSDPPWVGRTTTLTNNAPVFSSSNVALSIAENTAAGVDIGAAVTATDADAGDTLSYTLRGADAEFFDIVDTTGQIRTKDNVSYDFEAKPSYTVTVRVSDSDATAEASVIVSITDVAEPPDAPVDARRSRQWQGAPPACRSPGSPRPTPASPTSTATTCSTA